MWLPPRIQAGGKQWNKAAGDFGSRRAPQAGVGWGGWAGGASLISTCARQRLSHPAFIASVLRATSPAALSCPMVLLFFFFIVVFFFFGNSQLIWKAKQGGPGRCALTVMVGSCRMWRRASSGRLPGVGCGSLGGPGLAVGLPGALGVNGQRAWGSRALLGGHMEGSGAFQGGLGSTAGR